ncbi:hypothetical protein SAMD00019534_105450 [Acytostelium subglobosum LB1]|uniref:hypothetical protein n=1 Tax=Acytostelium subglobosum LB1 TaxID=1410327 RepID=UPI0006447C92|nr:hypothetical protein SAMD00019534_105450 [Acytostelium subglobosum LB1]GAM27370.1 hypothetical protein SAMD00019534_105450 [Acytostelium subglobosum LB1]|eukprot:XP_012749837.1 hypothetical protein SAMD00019534_105450 [Acytostelium subglobosum LB1]
MRSLLILITTLILLAHSQTQTQAQQQPQQIVSNWGFEYDSASSAWSDPHSLIGQPTSQYDVFQGQRAAIFGYPNTNSLTQLDLNQTVLFPVLQATPEHPWSPDQLLLQFAFKAPPLNITMTNTHFSFIVNVDETLVFWLTSSCYQDPDFNVELIDQYNLFNTDVTQFADGNNHNITFRLTIVSFNAESNFNLYIDHVNLFTTLKTPLEYDLFVSPSGDDTNNNGNKSSPFQTVQRAIDSISEQQSYTIYIDSAVYNFQQLASTVFTRGKTLTIVGLPSEQLVYPTWTGTVGTLLSVLPAPITYAYNPNTNCPIMPSKALLAPVSLSDVQIVDLTPSPSSLLSGCYAVIVTQGAQAVFASVPLLNHTSSSQMGLACVAPSATLSVQDSTFNNITTASPGSVFSSINGTLQITNTVFSNILYNSVRSTMGQLGITTTEFVRAGPINSITDRSVTLSHLNLHDATSNNVPLINLPSVLNSIDISDITIHDSSHIGGILCGMAAQTNIANVQMYNLKQSNNGLMISSTAQLSMSNVTVSSCSNFDTNDFNFISLVQVTGHMDAITISGISLETEVSIISVSQGSNINVTNLYMYNNQIPLVSNQGSILSFDHVTLYNNSLYSLVRCASGIFSISDTQVVNNLVTAIDTTDCQVSIASSNFSANANYIFDQYPLVTIKQGTLTMNDLTFSGNIGFDVLSLNGLETATLDSVTFDSNKFGCQLGAANCLQFKGDQLLFTGNKELQPVLELTNTTATITNSHLLFNVYPINITRSSISFDNLNIVNTTGDSAIRIQSSNGVWSNSVISNNTISPTGSTLHLEDSDISFVDVTLANLSSPSYPIGKQRGGNTSFMRCNITNTIGSVSGGFQVDSGTLIMVDSTLSNNFGKICAVLLASNSTINIVGSTIDNNVASESIVQLNQESSFYFTGSTFLKNILSNSLHITDSKGTIDQCRFQDNSDLGTIVHIKSSDVTIQGTTFLTSFTLNDGSYSTIHSMQSSLTILGSSFSNNLGTLRPALAIETTNIIVNNSRFESNVNLYGMGGILYLSQSTASINSNVFKKGSAHLGGCMFISQTSAFISNNTFSSCSASSGGAIFVDYSNINVTQCSFDQCSAWQGSYTDISDNSSYVNNGGAIAVTPITQFRRKTMVYVSSTYFTDNKAMLDGGVVWSSDSRTPTFVYQSSFIQNSASGGGGALFWEKQPIYELDDRFLNNIAIYGPQHATDGRKINLDFPKPPQRQLIFPIVGSFIDFYDQLVVNHPSYQFILNVRGIQNSNESITKQSAPYLGQSTFYATLTGEPGDQYLVNLTLLAPSGELLYKNVTVITIQTCMTNQYLRNNICALCPTGQIGYNGIECYVCPETTNCPDGNMYPNRGYWFSNFTFPPEIYKCDPTICLEKQCRPLHTGVLCGQCVPGAAKSAIYCHKCTKDNPGTIILFVLFCLGMTALLTRYSIPTRSILYSMFITLQLLGIMGERNDSFYFFSIFNFRIDFLPSCVSPKLSYLAKYYITIMSMVFVGLCSFILHGVQRVRRLFGLPLVEMNVQWTKRLISTALFFYVPITYTSLTLVPCKRIESSWYLDYDQGIECYTSAHIGAMTFGIVTMLLMSILLPLLTLLNRYHSHRTINPVLFAHLQPRYQHWDVIRLLICLLFIFISVGFQFYSSEQSLVIALLIGVGFAILYLNQPYKNDKRNRSEILLLFIVLLGTLASNSRMLTYNPSLGITLMVLSSLAIAVAAIYILLKLRLQAKLSKVK